MADTFGKTAILLFTRSARQEAVAKKFTFHSWKTNDGIAAGLIKQAVATARRSNIPYFISSGDECSETSFHFKLTYAAAALFKQGFEQLIIIGNDCPAISPTLLRETATQLENNQLVLGPATDGGVYLIGITKTAFQENAFAELPWLTQNLFQRFCEYGQQLNLRLTILPVYQDIDTAKDLRKYITQLPSTYRLAQLIISILATLTPLYQLFFSFIFSVKCTGQLPNRAPPTLLFF